MYNAIDAAIIECMKDGYYKTLEEIFYEVYIHDKDARCDMRKLKRHCDGLVEQFILQRVVTVEYGCTKFYGYILA